jgi:outer membrane protein TolC
VTRSPEIRLKPILHFVLMVTAAVGCVMGPTLQAHGQRLADRYPLSETQITETSGISTSQSSGKRIAPNEVKEISEDFKSGDAKATLEAARKKFAEQFDKAYVGMASLNEEHRSQPTLATQPDSADQSSTADNELLVKTDSVPTGANIYPLVTPLPKLADVTDRFPRVASKPADLDLSGGNDFQTTQLPALHGDSANSNPADAATGLNWWNQLVPRPLHDDNQVQTVDSNLLVYLALENSPRIQALSRDPLIRDFEVIEADSAFDAVSFLRSQFADRSDPLGGALDATRDGSDTIENHNWTAEGGLRKRARTGATYELSQRLGFENSNVAVFDPNNQGTAQIALNVTQPLARGRGRYINQSQILIAQSRGGAAWESFSAELQAEIEAVVSAYWRLYYDRSVFLQKKRNVERVAEILATLEGRANLDSLPSQITRARSTLQSRKTDLANAFRDVRNSETELRRLIADRNWQANQFVELLPVESPVNATIDISLDHVVTTSLENRPEIRETMQRAKLAGIERDISVNDLLPELSLLLGTYVSTLQDDGRIGRAFVDQFGQTKPGYSVGLEFELPVGNRAARSRLVQRKLRLAKIKNQVDEAMQNVIAESQTSLRRLNSAAETLDAANEAIEAARSDMQQNILRWENFALVEGDFSDGQTPTTVLDQLLDSQERLAAAELVAAQSQLELKVAEVALQRSMGTLLIQKQINPRRAFECGSPKIKF